MDHELERPFMELLDKSLLQHTVDTGTKAGGPEIVDVYRLQGLAEIHYHLKFEHELTINEVAALMKFSDPLVVAMECWSERSPQEKFSITDLLDQIGAYTRFPLVNSAEYTQRQGEKVAAAKAALDQNMAEYYTSLRLLDKEAIISKSGETAAMQAAHAFMINSFFFRPGDAETLLSMEHPLQAIAKDWPFDVDCFIDLQDLIGEVILGCKNEMPQHCSDVAEGKTSLRGQLQAAVKEAAQHSAMNHHKIGGEAR